MTETPPLSARKRRESLDSPGARTIESMERVNNILEQPMQPIQIEALNRESLEGGVRDVFNALNAQIDDATVEDEPNADMLQTAVQRCMLMMAQRIDGDVTRLAAEVVESQLKIGEQMQTMDEMSAFIASQSALSALRTAEYNAALENQNAINNRLEKERANIAAQQAALDAKVVANNTLQTGMMAKVEILAPGSTRNILTSAVRDGVSHLSVSKSFKYMYM